jgi:hypothetical protein
MATTTRNNDFVCSLLPTQWQNFCRKYRILFARYSALRFFLPDENTTFDVDQLFGDPHFGGWIINGLQFLLGRQGSARRVTWYDSYFSEVDRNIALINLRREEDNFHELADTSFVKYHQFLVAELKEDLRILRSDTLFFKSFACAIGIPKMLFDFALQGDIYISDNVYCSGFPFREYSVASGLKLVNTYDEEEERYYDVVKFSSTLPSLSVLPRSMERVSMVDFLDYATQQIALSHMRFGESQAAWNFGLDDNMKGFLELISGDLGQSLGNVTACVDKNTAEVAEAVRKLTEAGITVSIEPDVKQALIDIAKGYTEQVRTGVKVEHRFPDINLGLDSIGSLPIIILMCTAGAYALYKKEAKWLSACAILAMILYVTCKSTLGQEFVEYIKNVFFPDFTEGLAFSQAPTVEEDAFIGKSCYLAISALLFKQSKSVSAGAGDFLRTIGNFDRASTGITGILTFVTECLEKAVNFIFGMLGWEKDFSLMSKHKDELQLWIDEVATTYKTFQDTKLAITRTNFDTLQRLSATGRGFLAPSSPFCEISGIRNTVGLYLRVLNEMEQPFKTANIGAHNIRMEPVVIMISGEPGVGKTWAIVPLIISVLSRVLPEKELDAFEKNHMDFIYPRQAEHKFWDGYRGQHTTVFDDFGQIRDVAGQPDNENLDLIRTGNMFPNVLHMAAMENKGTTYYSSKFIVCTSNRPNLDGIASIYQPQAVLRRFNIDVAAGPKAEYSVDPTVPFESRKLDQKKAGDSFNKDIYEFRSKKDSKVYTFDELVDELVLKFAVSEKKDANFTQNVNDLKAKLVAERKKQAKARSGTSQVAPDTPGFTKYMANIARNELDEFREAKDTQQERNKAASREKSLLEKYLDLYPDAVNCMSMPTIENLPILENPKKDEVDHGPLGDHKTMYSVDYQFEKRQVDVGPYSTTFQMKMRNLVTGEEYRSWLKSTPKMVQWEQWINQTYAKLPKEQQLGVWRWFSAVLYVVHGDELPEDRNHLGLLAFHLMDQDKVRKMVAINGMATPTEFPFEVPPREGISKFLHSFWTGLKQAYILLAQPIFLYLTILGLIRASSWVMRTTYKWFTGKDWDTASTGEEPVRVNEVPIVRTGVSQVDANTDEIIDKVVRKNVYSLYAGHHRFGGVVALRDTFVMMPSHFVTKIKTDKALKVSQGVAPSTLYLRSLDGKNEFILNYEDIEKAETDFDLDFSLVKLNLGMAFPNICHLIVSSEDLEKKPDLAVTLATPRNIVHGIRPNEMVLAESTAKFAKPVTCSMGEGYSSVLVKKPVEYKMSTKAGDCGFPLFLHNPGVARKFLGFHVGAVNGGSGLGIATTIEYVNTMLGKFETVPVTPTTEEVRTGVCQDGKSTSGITNHGPAEFKFMQPANTKIRKSVLYEAWGPAKKQPAVLLPVTRDGVKVKPLDKAVGKYAAPPPEIDETNLEMCGDFLLQTLQQRSNVRVDKEILTYEQAVLGIPGDPFLSSMPRGTSAGFPLSVAPVPGNPGKTFYWGRGNLFDLDRAHNIALKKEVAQIEEYARKGIRCRHYCTDILKDELRLHEKIDQVKTRLISGCPIAYCILFRMYFLPFAAWMMKNHVSNYCAIGINPYSEEWNTMYRLLTTMSQFGLDADIEGFDTSQVPAILRVVFLIIDGWFNDGNTAVRWVLWLEVINSWHISKDNIYEWHKGLPSGHPFTTIINCLYLLMIYLLCWLKAHGDDPRSLSTFFDNVFPVVFGDDSVVALSPYAQKHFNLSILKKTGLHFGIKFTSGSKTEEYDFKPVSELTFLKRGFYFSPDNGRVLAPLSLDTILEMPYWYSKGDNPTSKQAENLDQALLELSMHPPEVWDRWAPKMIRASQEKLAHYPIFTSRLSWLNLALGSSNFW